MSVASSWPQCPFLSHSQNPQKCTCKRTKSGHWCILPSSTKCALTPVDEGSLTFVVLAQCNMHGKGALLELLAWHDFVIVVDLIDCKCGLSPNTKSVHQAVTSSGAVQKRNRIKISRWSSQIGPKYVCAHTYVCVCTDCITHWVSECEGRM